MALLIGLTMTRDVLLRELITAAESFHSRRMWERFTNSDCFGVLLPGHSDLVLATVMGNAGEEHGLTVFRGAGAAKTCAQVTGGLVPGSDVIESIDMLGFSMDRFGELSPDVQASFRQAGLHPRLQDQVPTFIAKPPHRRPRWPTDDELALLRTVLTAAVAADSQGLLEPAELDDDAGICVIMAADGVGDPDISVTRQTPPESSVLSGPETFAASGVDLSGLPRSDARWLVGTPIMPVGVDDDDRSMQLLLVADDHGEMILQATPFFSEEIGKAIDQLVATCRTHGVPSSMVFTSQRLVDALAPTLASAGVQCTYEPGHPRIAELTEDFLSHLGIDAPSFEGFMQHDEDEDGDDDHIPAPDDLTGWKRADRRLSQRFAHHLTHGERPRSARAIKRYFRDDDLESFFEEHADRAVAMAYSSWCMLDYRPTKNSKTQAQIMLAEGLPPAETALLQARMQAYPTIYRVTGHDPAAGTIDLEDVLVEGVVRIHDQLMSENIDDGVFLVGRAFTAGQFHFFEVVGPPLGAGMALHAIEFLRRCKLSFTPEGLKLEAHKLGWLWGWIDEWEAEWQPPHLCNIDGDDMRFHTASFHLDDVQAVREALARRSDIEYDEQNDEFVWFRPTDQDSMMIGDSVTLARLELIDDELVLSVNSAERFAAARQWLEQLPGVRFVDVTTRQIEPSGTAGPPDEQMAEDEPFEPTPEMLGQIQEQITRQYFNWLDTPLPVLNDRTPRQACKTTEGREKVRTLIRTIPDPMGNAPVHVPRHAMLRELGLAGESVEAVSPPEPWVDSPRPPSTKVGRNDPCPCGSGRKYKKCCGAS
ncbi:MAG: SEC-C domain-containing protein [Phycisphaerae bacterium]|nr:SEC-C domain-containing protein [Phycisphaerae bacterium]